MNTHDSRTTRGLELDSATAELVKNQILRLGVPGVEAASIHRDAHLIEDLGLDSLKFVDLTVGLEDALGIDEFPMQDWVDTQLAEGGQLTFGALVLACRSLST